MSLRGSVMPDANLLFGGIAKEAARRYDMIPARLMPLLVVSARGFEVFLSISHRIRDKNPLLLAAA